MGWEHEFSGSTWYILEKCPDRWAELVHHPAGRYFPTRRPRLAAARHHGRTG
ncbi:hypothetical protein [Streptomyces sp. AcE210]|uniref:hypothetical protein n=1 Tax=Streptomyces sp. AcE210 TaxID=2292703 RepID=UPI00140435B3|nr:hypothetical protein [Streptomyces sp. AcE210]